MLKWINKKRNKKGFTLVELVVVIAILGVLATIAVPKLGGFRARGADAADRATAATIVKAAELYNATAKSGEELQEKDDMIAALVEADLIDGISTDQGKVKAQKDGEILVLVYDNIKHQFYVRYESDTSNENILYPEEYKPGTEQG